MNKTKIKEEKGVTAIDIAISVIILTIFIALLGNLIVNINLNTVSSERKNIATGYAVKEIEQIKSKGYVKEEYDGKGIDKEETLEGTDKDIIDSEGNFTGYHKKIKIEDYALNNKESESNLVKKITVDISYKVGGKDKNVTISTYVKRSEI